MQSPTLSYFTVREFAATQITRTHNLYRNYRSQWKHFNRLASGGVSKTFSASLHTTLVASALHEVAHGFSETQCAHAVPWHRLRPGYAFCARVLSCFPLTEWATQPTFRKAYKWVSGIMHSWLEKIPSTPLVDPLYNSHVTCLRPRT